MGVGFIMDGVVIVYHKIFSLIVHKLVFISGI